MKITQLLLRVGTAVGLAAVMPALLFLMVSPVSANDHTCNGWLLGAIDGNVTVTGDCVIMAATISGNVKQEDKDQDFNITVVNSTVEGDIKNKGDGDVTVGEDAWVKGNIKNKGNGDVTIKDMATIDGIIKNNGNGALTVANSTVEGDIKNKGDGALTVVNSTVDGNIKNKGDGAETVHHVVGSHLQERQFTVVDTAAVV